MSKSYKKNWVPWTGYVVSEKTNIAWLILLSRYCYTTGGLVLKALCLFKSLLDTSLNEVYNWNINISKIITYANLYTSLVDNLSVNILYLSFYRSSTDISAAQYRVAISPSSVTFELFTTFKGSVVLPLNTNIADGLWHHVTVSWSNQFGFITLYIDGTFDNEKIFAENKNITPL